MLSIQPRQRKALATGAFLAVVWAIGAALQPTSTYHLAPLLVAGLIPGVAGAATKTDLINATTAGAGLALATTAVLSAFDLLRGPTLLPYGGALAEAVTFAVVGALAGAAFAVIAAASPHETAT